jgi:mannose-6-phosphate isomerase-like protein (cupin superfamily)
MATEIKTPETRGHDAETLESGKGVLDRQLEELYANNDPDKPQLFHMTAKLPKKGRGATLLAATDRMWVNLKTYAEGGENALHAHTNEDHTFIVLAGEAIFYGPDGETARLGKNQGILLPRNVAYRFHAVEGEPLVILRMGTIIDPERPAFERMGPDGKPVPASSKANKSEVTEFYEDRVFE